ncbi:helix-turn-helix domain-containing protein [Streptomyces coelicoflavus]|uniref:helix-turn-helix domain-containing protein n=1 Tax=Streptomyces coelicoflavus TaxID=285562 RepID=UPI0036ABC6E8
MEVSRRLRITPDTVRTWRRRFLERGLDGLCDDPRPGVPRKITDADVERVIVKTLEERPKNATHWSTRSMAAATGMSQSSISRIWRGVRPGPAPLTDVQAVYRPAVHRQGPRRRRPLSRSAGEGPGALRGREVADCVPRTLKEALM